MQSEQINELAAALCKAQHNTLFALKDSKNPFFKSKYADLSSVWDAAREPLTSNGLSIAQTMEAGENDSVVIVTTLMHTSGQWIKSSLPVKPLKNDPQGVGSAITYGRRYGLQAMVGICPEDDDGNRASVTPSKQPPPQKQEVTPDKKDWWARAVNVYRKDGNFDAIEKHAIISEENKQLIIEDAAI